MSNGPSYTCQGFAFFQTLYQARAIFEIFESSSLIFPAATHPEFDITLESNSEDISSVTGADI